jgi:nucleotide-binding universal stress UspA family protein
LSRDFLLSSPLTGLKNFILHHLILFSRAMAQPLTHTMLPTVSRRCHQGEGEGAVVHGIPFQAILTTATAHHGDLIMMGTHGRTGLTHVLLGSVAEKVVRVGPCPVWVTRPPEQTPEP